MGLAPYALPSEVLRKLQVGWVAFWWEPGSAQGWKEEGGKLGLCSVHPPWPGSHQAGCAFLALPAPLHMAVAGGWWPRLGDLRLLPPPWEGGESRAEPVIIVSPAPGRPKPVPSIPGMAQSRGMEEPSRGRWGEVRGGGTVSCRMCCSPGSSEEAGPASFSGSYAGRRGRRPGFCPSGSLQFLSWRPHLDE